MIQASWWRRYLCSWVILGAWWLAWKFVDGYVTGLRARLDTWTVIESLVLGGVLAALPRSNRRDRPTQGEVLAAVDPATRRELGLPQPNCR